MAEFIGTEQAVALQKHLRNLQSVIANTPELSNGGRTLHFLNPEVTGWEHVREIADQYRIIGFPVVQADDMVAQIRQYLGPDWETPKWLAYLGERDRVLKACETVQRDVLLPDGWRVEHHVEPPNMMIVEVQNLNLKTGVAPYPAYYMRSEAVPVLTSCIRDHQGVVVATASVADRYHAQGRLAGHVFAGMVSVDETCRGRGLGKLINALALIESAARFNWTAVTEHVAADNMASRAMIAACGLGDSAGMHSVIALRPGETFTR
ncbi:GNAT family N-acetyltransferase [Roseovarius sp. EL26]|uniref:GNAT family N-acetyltransferase n=1 Tax=Roseovarius sp. EL26 TaxID=2126672 RepID=UPI0013C4857A|nr:GNAT family N-acetyltransferase [Roseovarius sp. EL26]